jgi:hypothetical protein
MLQLKPTKIRSILSVLEATLDIYHRFGRKTDVFVATLGHLGSPLGATNAKNHYFFAFFSPIKLAFEATTPPKAAFFSPNWCSRCGFSSCNILAALRRLSVAIVGHVAKLGEMGVFCLKNQNQNLASRV